jgi:hypothetical protein
MNTNLKECNRLEVLELTGELRESKSRSPLRNAIVGKGISLESVALPFFVEDEHGNEYGLLVSLESVIEFQFNEDLNELKKWKESKEPEGDYDDVYREVEWTREMLKNKDI